MNKETVHLEVMDGVQITHALKNHGFVRWVKQCSFGIVHWLGCQFTRWQAYIYGFEKSMQLNCTAVDEIKILIK